MPADTPELLRIYAPYVRQTTISFETCLPTLDVMEQRVRETLVQYPWLVAENQDGVCGYAYAGPFRTRVAYEWCAEVTVYIDQAARGAGCGRELYGSLLRTLRKQNYFQAIAAIALPNPVSVAFHESLGFRCVGILPAVGYKAESWVDVGYWQRTLQATSLRPRPPLSFSKLQQT